jgi:hypothetical protein
VDGWPSRRRGCGGGQRYLEPVTPLWSHSEFSSDPVYVVEGGKLHQVPNPAEFEARGFEWGAIGVVPDSTLAGLSQGEPLPITVN